MMTEDRYHTELLAAFVLHDWIVRHLRCLAHLRRQEIFQNRHHYSKLFHTSCWPVRILRELLIVLECRGSVGQWLLVYFVLELQCLQLFPEYFHWLSWTSVGTCWRSKRAFYLSLCFLMEYCRKRCRLPLFPDTVSVAATSHHYQWRCRVRIWNGWDVERLSYRWSDWSLHFVCFRRWRSLRQKDYLLRHVELLWFIISGIAWSPFPDFLQRAGNSRFHSIGFRSWFFQCLWMSSSIFLGN